MIRWRLVTTPAFDRSMKRLSIDVQRRVRDSLKELCLLEDPRVRGKPLRRNESGGGTASGTTASSHPSMMIAWSSWRSRRGIARRCTEGSRSPDRDEESAIRRASSQRVPIYNPIPLMSGW